MTASCRLGAPVLALLLGGVCAIPGAGQDPPGGGPADLSGSWRLDREASTIDSGVELTGLGGNAGVPSVLYVTQARNGTVVVGSNMNTSHARTYVPGVGAPGEETTTPLGAGEVRVRSRWQERKLVAEGHDSGTSTELSETYQVSTDGLRLTVEVAMTGPDGERFATLVYVPLEREPPCEEWTTPCKDWSEAAFERVVFTGARLIDGRGGPPIEPATILVEGGRVVAAGPADEVAEPEPGEGETPARRIDLTGRTVVPGLLNAHGHVGTTRGLSSAAEHYTAANIRSQLDLYASYGVTTVASLGGGGEVGIRVRDQRFPGSTQARLMLAGPVVAARTPEAAREQVAAVVALGADLVKIRVDDQLGRVPKMSPEVYTAVIEEAHRLGLDVAAHLFYLEDAKGLVRAGADLLAHSVRDREVDEELIGLLLERGVCLSPTLTREVSAFVYRSRPEFFDDPFFLRPFERGSADPAPADPAVLEQLADPDRQRRVGESPEAAAYEQALEVAKRNLRRLADAGVVIAFGTDSGPPGRFQGYFEHLELELMAEAGMTPQQILLAATRDAARCLGRDDVGVVEPGRWADLLVLDADPLEDVGNLRRIHSVWIGGREVETGGRSAGR
ncbi:MAG TPA: amidohydrolase family protein [Thermoanaerobaculia bacterium]|nr:amidohydrolase family protein [Thermoanaerobaculia bacterium]